MIHLFSNSLKNLLQYQSSNAYTFLLSCFFKIQLLLPLNITVKAQEYLLLLSYLCSYKHIPMIWIYFPRPLWLLYHMVVCKVLIDFWFLKVYFPLHIFIANSKSINILPPISAAQALDIVLEQGGLLCAACACAVACKLFCSCTEHYKMTRKHASNG